LDEEEVDVLRLRISLSMSPHPRCTLTSMGYRVSVQSLGCASACASLAIVSSLPTLPPEVTFNVCGKEVSVRLEGTPIPNSEPLLIIHGKCDLRLGDRALELPCGHGELPAYLPVRNLGELQELGLNVKGKVLYKGDLSAYLVLLPTGGELIAGKAVRLNPGGYLLVTEGSGKLKVEGEELILP